jgi:hypothetical protein
MDCRNQTMDGDYSDILVFFPHSTHFYTEPVLTCLKHAPRGTCAKARTLRKKSCVCRIVIIEEGY